MCSSNYNESQLIDSISDTISGNETYVKFICGDFSEELRGNLNMLIRERQTHPELEKFHDQLIEYQAKEITENIPKDYDNFLFSFKDPTYRNRLHLYLLGLQIEDKIDGISHDVDVFTNQYINFEWHEYRLEVSNVSMIKIGVHQNKGEANSYLPIRALIDGECLKIGDDRIVEKEKVQKTIEFQLRKNEYDEWKAQSREVRSSTWSIRN